jgi:urease accessory protein
MNLYLLQLGDSALPIGGYSHSWGLEAAIHEGLVTNPGTLENWTRCWLRHVVGPFEGILVSCCCLAALRQDRATIRRANELAWTSTVPATLRLASRDMGEQLLALSESWAWAENAASELRNINSSIAEASEWHHACVFGTLAAAAGSSPEEAVIVYLHQAALGSISAGVRTIPIGHTHGQEVLARLHDDIYTLARDFAGRELDSAGSFCPAHEILCHAQNHLYTRLFRS